MRQGVKRLVNRYLTGIDKTVWERGEASRQALIERYFFSARTAARVLAT